MNPYFFSNNSNNPAKKQNSDVWDKLLLDIFYDKEPQMNFRNFMKKTKDEHGNWNIKVEVPGANKRNTDITYSQAAPDLPITITVSYPGIIESKKITKHIEHTPTGGVVEIEAAINDGILDIHIKETKTEKTKKINIK